MLSRSLTAQILTYHTSLIINALLHIRSHVLFGGDRGHSAQARGQRSEVVEMGVHPGRGSDQWEQGSRCRASFPWPHTHSHNTNDFSPIDPQPAVERLTGSEKHIAGAVLYIYKYDIPASLILCYCAERVRGDVINQWSSLINNWLNWAHKHTCCEMY